MVLEKEDITLECEVVGKPPPRVIWLKNGDQITQGDNFKFVNGTNLKISDLLVMDTGIFQCLASNPAGNIQSSAFLNVLVTAEKPKSLKNNPSSSIPSSPKAFEAILVSTREHIMTTETITIKKLMFDNHYFYTDITLVFILITCCMIIISCIGLEIILVIKLKKSFRRHEVAVHNFTQDPY